MKKQTPIYSYIQTYTSRYNIYTHNTSFTAFRIPRDLRDTVVNSRTSCTHTNPGFTSCNSSISELYQHFKPLSSFRSSKNGKQTASPMTSHDTQTTSSTSSHAKNVTNSAQHKPHKHLEQD
ncbi:hypothetical protein PoB_004421100 [Plakobranchus ocellatus]|uniref:Uncharacterized protein n=1 Tax=Plakobranchus ocellatus TaxID=259542 RepID=A0AAV4BBA6_9GAST|nr:hypothetical protein PoB_004421100 [Plakobranchus ocellatus]